MSSIQCTCVYFNAHCMLMTVCKCLYILASCMGLLIILCAGQNLIDLAGSESSKTETTGIRRKEGSYINKSLLTLGTVSAFIFLLASSILMYNKVSYRWVLK